MSSIIERLNTILRRMELAKRTVVHAASATLVAVSKGHSSEAIELLLKAGHRDFGENRIQEALSKWPALKRSYPDVRLHLIGTLQTNKVKDALGLFDVIETVDRESLVDAIVKARGDGLGMECRFFVQVNTGEEPQKSGVLPHDLTGLMHYTSAPRPSPLSSLPITGLMCIPPANEPSAPHFAFLRKRAMEFNLPYLSMGMSGDYETALRLGATYIRVGTALFGERDS